MGSGLDCNYNIIRFGKFEKQWVQLKDVYYNIEPGVQYHMKVVAKDANIKIYIDNSTGPIIEFNDTTYSSGSFGFRTYCTHAHFDNLIVKDADNIPPTVELMLPGRIQYDDGDYKDNPFAVGNLTALTYPDGKVVSYEFNKINRLVKVTDWNNRSTEYQYDANGRLLKTLRPNGTVLTLAYDVAGQVITRKETDFEGNSIIQHDYTYDKAGNILEEKSSIVSNNN